MNSRLIRERGYQSMKPFDFRLGDGTGVTVARSDFIAMTSGQILVLETSSRVPRVNPLHVGAIEDWPREKAKTKANGQRSR